MEEYKMANVKNGRLVNLVESTFKPEDVTILLKNLTSDGMKELSTEERERLIQSGVHYSEMLPLEYVPTNEYLKLYEKSLKEQTYLTAKDLATMSEAIILFKKERELKENLTESKRIAVVSLARAGTPIGVLFKRYMDMFHPEYNVAHYTASIIRGRGIDRNAMNYVASQENVSDIVFLDGWTGKGAINNVLKLEVYNLKQLDNEKWKDLSDELVVMADPANICRVCGTHLDRLVPSSCLNSTVTGLISRTILNKNYINESDGDFHGAVYFGHNDGMLEADKTYEFIDAIVDFLSKKFDAETVRIVQANAQKILDSGANGVKGIDIVKNIAQSEGVDDFNKIKPGVGECTRVLLRRVPKKILVNSDYIGNESIEHIFQLARERNVEVESSTELGNYGVVGVIADLSDV